MTGAKHEGIETEPGVYRNTEIKGDDYDAFVLASLLPDTGSRFTWAKMTRQHDQQNTTRTNRNLLRNVFGMLRY